MSAARMAASRRSMRSSGISVAPGGRGDSFRRCKIGSDADPAMPRLEGRRPAASAWDMYRRCAVAPMRFMRRPRLPTMKKGYRLLDHFGQAVLAQNLHKADRD